MSTEASGGVIDTRLMLMWRDHFRNPAVLAGLAGAAGTLLGALIALLSGLVAAFAQAEAEDERALRTTRTDAYGELLSSIYLYSTEVSRAVDIAVNVDQPNDDADVDRLRKAWASTSEQLDKVRALLATARILGGSEVDEALDAFVNRSTAVNNTVQLVFDSDESGATILERGDVPTEGDPFLEVEIQFKEAAQAEVIP
jgi:hypothetical protein